MQVTRPINALEAQAAYATHLLTQQTLAAREAFCEAYMASSTNVQFIREDLEIKIQDYTAPATTVPVHPLERKAFAMGLRDNEHFVFDKGRTVFLTNDAFDLITESAKTLPDEVLLESEVPDYPFVLWFETPYQYSLLIKESFHQTDANLRQQEDWGIRAIAFRRESKIGREGENSVGPGLMMTVYADSECITHWGKEVPAHLKNRIVLVDLLPMRFGLSWWQKHDETGATWVRDLKQWVVAMFRLMGDHIEREPVKLDRATSRRETRRGRPADGYLTTLRLRKVVYTDHGPSGSGRSATFRHLVRGHWRKFYCPSTKKPVGDPAAYRHKYVNDYIRGPKTEEFVASQQVITIAR